MRKMNLGVIAITSTMMLACTTETTTQTAPVAASSTTAPSAWRSKLALAQRTGNAKAVALLAGKRAGSPKIGATQRVMSGSAAPTTCGLSTGDATCDSCVDASCCAQNTACVSDPDCAALLTCGDACTDDACVSGCFATHPTGATLLDTLSTCVGNSCAAACGGGPAGPPSVSACGFGSGDATCDSCLDTNCCADANTCIGDADCTALLDCGFACSDAACEAACEAAHPSGASKLSALSSCANNTCASACATPPPTGPSAGSCGLTSGDMTCDTCLDASCCGPTTSCLSDTDCVALLQCYDACADATCAAACDAAHPSGGAKLTAVSSCVQTSCASTCGF